MATDRFERMVANKYFNDRSDADDAVKLLRQEHAWMRRMVMQEYSRLRDQRSYKERIMNRLEQRRKG